jgi:hypothetical protein
MIEVDRSLQAQAENAGKTASSTGAGYGSSASTIAGSLIPTLNREAAGNDGLTPTQKSQQLTSALQGGGGAASSIAGAAGLTAARTRNSGALSGVQDAAARAKTQAGSTANLDIENESTQLAAERQQEALGQLGGLYNTDVSAQLKSMGLIPEDVNAGANAGKEGWLQNTLATINTLKPSGSFGGGESASFGFG